MLCGCGGMWSKMDVLHDGTIVPCHVLHDLHLGTVGDDDFQEIWLQHPTMAALRERHRIPLEALETCADCPYVGFCTGGCPQGALLVYGELNARNPYNCYRVLKGEDPYVSLSEGAPDGLMTEGQRETERTGASC
jgi:radical SAM protein with 4Fe4S-binding SPASM domain